jgi:hypothetical protein
LSDTCVFRSPAIGAVSVETEYAACIAVRQRHWRPLEPGCVDPENAL